MSDEVKVYEATPYLSRQQLEWVLGMPNGGAARWHKGGKGPLGWRVRRTPKKPGGTANWWWAERVWQHALTAAQLRNHRRGLLRHELETLEAHERLARLLHEYEGREAPAFTMEFEFVGEGEERARVLKPQFLQAKKEEE